MNQPPASKLTLERPDLWARALELATGLTGYEYAPKVPLPDGTIYACGGGGAYRYYNPPPPPKPKTPEEIRQEEIDDLEEEIDDLEERIRKNRDGIERSREEIAEREGRIAEYEAEIAEKKDRLAKIKAGLVAAGILPAPVVMVPEGAMEWLLHEVGHWIAATPEERLLPDYGYGQGILINGLGAARELQSWAFEEMILAPFGPARSFCPPQHQGGTAFERSVDRLHYRHIEERIRQLGVDSGQWRHLYGEWVHWHKSAYA